MPYTTEHVLLTARGDAWTQNEAWQFGIRMTTTTAPTDALLQTIADDAASATSTFFSHTDVSIKSTTRLLELKVAHILSTGLYPPTSAPGIHTYPSPVAGGSTNVTYPQIALAVTTGTAAARGRASKGRFYLPTPTLTAASDGLLTETAVEAVEAQAVIWINALNAITGVGSCAVMSKLGDGTTNLITTVGVGRTVDTMRSRRRSLVEQRDQRSL